MENVWFPLEFYWKEFDAELLFTGTGSLTYEIKSENVYEEFVKWKDLFDFSSYSKDPKFLMRLIKTLLAKWKMDLVELV